MTATNLRSFDRPAAVVGAVLIVVAAVLAYDAGHMSKGAIYGIGPTAFPNVLAIFFAGLGAAHVIVAFRQGLPKPDQADWSAFAWVSGALLALIGSVSLGLGFILGATLLFAMTARAFGRRAFGTDLLIGFVIGVLVFLLFNNLLSLTLPQGPLERLL